MNVLFEMVLEHDDIAEYILKNYRNKVVEIGVGNRPHVALSLKEYMDVFVTDVNEQKCEGVVFRRDDVFFPDMGIYRNASLIYSIRPPIDIQDAMAKIAMEVGADLLIRPFSNEKADLGRYYKTWELVNYKNARFYLYRSLK